MYDVAIVGSGPAGAACAAFCARAGLRVIVFERETFPREKVCGDCLNPACTPVLQRLGIADDVRALPHGKLRRVDFIAIGGRTVSVDLPDGAEIAVKRSLFDDALMRRARSAGATVREGVTVTALVAPVSSATWWKLTASGEQFEARAVVAADGRNSSVARLLGLLPRIAKDRVALQTHIPLPAGFGGRVVLQFLREGYSGQAPVNDQTLNVCLVGRAHSIPALRSRAESTFGIAADHTWRTITPLRRAALAPAASGLFLVGDAARVVEPFTGEGIYYALRSGELAAESIATLLQSSDAELAARIYGAAHENLYRGRLWVNRVARAAVLSPRFTSALLRAHLLPPATLRALTTKIVR
ncbi:MAG: NAD(P)/FAD-dependent oxidoreductase [Verrucomicrobiota bacterium]|nr:NAD(P)/FAD-dependent oxidoreductase [Verrucomicrobiota bacterium]